MVVLLTGSPLKHASLSVFHRRHIASLCLTSCPQTLKVQATCVVALLVGLGMSLTTGSKELSVYYEFVLPGLPDVLVLS